VLIKIGQGKRTLKHEKLQAFLLVSRP